MKYISSPKLILLVPAFWAALFDMTITTLYQPKEYWNGNLNIVNEANPIGAFAMKYHISGFFIICFLWLLLIWIIGLRLDNKKLLIFTLFVLMCHTWGGSSWILNQFGFVFVILYILLNSTLFNYCLEKYNSKINSKIES